MPTPFARRSCLALLATIALLTGRHATGAALEYASPDQSVWTTRTNKQGEIDNPFFRVAAVLFARADIPWHGRTYPATRMFKYLQGGSA